VAPQKKKKDVECRVPVSGMSTDQVCSCVLQGSYCANTSGYGICLGQSPRGVPPAHRLGVSYNLRQ